MYIWTYFPKSTLIMDFGKCISFYLFCLLLNCMSELTFSIIILYLKIVQNNDTVKLALFSTVESNILTNKNVTQMVKRIKWTKKLKLSQAFIQ